MRDCSTNRAGFDRVLMAVAATFLAVSATSALAAQSDTPRTSAAELAIDAAVPRPEPANVPPPTIGDFKIGYDRGGTRRSQDGSARTEHDRNGSRSEAGRNRHRAAAELPKRSQQRHRDHDARNACARRRSGTCH